MTATRSRESLKAVAPPIRTRWIRRRVDHLTADSAARVRARQQLGGGKEDEDALAQPCAPRVMHLSRWPPTPSRHRRGKPWPRTVAARMNKQMTSAHVHNKPVTSATEHQRKASRRGGERPLAHSLSHFCTFALQQQQQQYLTADSAARVCARQQLQQRGRLRSRTAAVCAACHSPQSLASPEAPSR
jgi:hypothetical protein